MSEREESQHEVITISDDECDIQSEPSMAWLLNNDVKDDNQATSSGSLQSSKSESYKPPKRRRKRRSRTKFNDENCDDLSKDKSYQNYQVRPRQQSDNEARRRSPRNTPEAKESRIRSRSLGISDGLLNSETHYDYAQLTQQQLKMASHSLAEVNRKLPSVSWKPLD